ncbi:hypothetical protein GCM10019059_36400 [Camelimonas fluminis]|uniref:Uncharacterized protein n=1 Tax=Camelimonas fluminis TaxID=1576911 RepID=A0ABV7UBQ8_9HYPH|nr:hypothetical protein [Camelimonas fluminis]GHE73575.1 hypothetical protein GCM10019059_36400 [Camelimonas fluminis]
MKKVTLSILALCLSAVTAAAGDVSGKGPNGGRIGDAGAYHVEFVSKGNEASAFVYDHENKPVNAEKLGGSVTFLVEGDTVTAPLVPKGGNRLDGVLPKALPDTGRVVVTVQAPDGKQNQARFRLK